MNGKTPVCVGVPESKPVALRESPLGSEPVETANVTCPLPPPARNCTGLYGEPKVPFGAMVGVICRVVGPDEPRATSRIGWVKAVAGLKLPRDVSISD